MDGPLLDEILEFARGLSREAGQFIMPLWKNVAVDHKADGSEVTAADRGAEQLMRRRIAERYPEHAILGEEFGGDVDREAEHLWLLDPVDGTATFAVGLPVFGTLIGYMRRGEACVGVIGAHALGETVFAAAGQGCWMEREDGEVRRVHSSAVAQLTQAHVISTGLENTDMDPWRPNPAVRLTELCRRSRRFRWSGDCVNYALLCQGRIDVAVDPRMHPWDIAALAPCVREAGGSVSGLDGNPDVVWQENLVASAGPELHAEVLRALGGA